MRRFSPAQAVAALITIFFLALLSACGGSSKSTNPVTKIVLSPTNLSLNEGQVLTLSAQAQNFAGQVVAADITFSSSNTNLVTVTSGGAVCGGKFDSNNIVCSPAGDGQATITATSGSVTATSTVYVHRQVDKVVVTPPPDCTSVNGQPAVSATAFNTSAPGCSVSAPCDITSSVGPFTFGSSDTSLIAPNVTTGVLTAINPGLTSVFASVSGVNSVSAPAVVCPAAVIVVHDAASSNTKFTVAKGATQTVTAEVYDTKGQFIHPTLTWSSSSLGAATVAPGTNGTNNATITGTAPGFASITATCSHPDCNKNLSPMYSWNVATVTVPGTSSTTVYAASTKSVMLVPIATSTNTVGTTITLPNGPNSILSDPAGSKLYIGSDAGLMSVDTGTGAVSTSFVHGKVQSISPDGKFLLVADTNGGTDYINLSTNSLVLSHPFPPVSGVFTPDSKWLLFLSGQTLYRDAASLGSSNFALNYQPTAIDLLAQGSLAFITNNAGHAIDVRSTCDSSDLQTLSSNNPSLVKGLPNGLGAIVADAPAIDVITTPKPSGSCPVVAQNTITGYDLGQGTFTPKQLFLSNDSSRAWIISDLPSVITFDLGLFLPTPIPLANNAIAFNGGITGDGQQVYVGANDNAVHRIDVPSLKDAQQIAPNLKDANGNTVPPDLVAVLPH